MLLSRKGDRDGGRPVEYVVYIDVFFLTDFFLNLFSLFLTSAFLRKPVSFWRMALAAVIGSMWNCAVLIWPMRSVLAELVLTVFGVGSLMAAVAFDQGCWNRRLHIGKLWSASDRACRNWWHWIHKLLLADMALCASTALLAGGMSFVRDRCFLTDWECLAAAGLLTAAAGIFVQGMLRPEEVGALRLHVRLYYRGEAREFTALADSGNRLFVPETGKPVSLISWRDCIGFCDRISGGFFIPYRAVGTNRGLLFAITFEKMEIEKNGMCITIEKPAVAIVKETLSSNGDFNMIIPEEYVSRF